MKRLLVFLSFLMTMSFGVVGQENPPSPPAAPEAVTPPEPPAPPLPPEVRMERFESMKVAHITSSLSLTPEEAQVFWPVYNEWAEKKKSLRQDLRPTQNLDDMDEAEAEAYLEEVMDQRKAMAELEEGMVDDLKEVIPASKVAKLLQAERSFHKAVVKKYREKRGRFEKDRPRGARMQKSE